MSFNARFSGSFTSTATPDRHDVILPQGEPDYFKIVNRTDWNATSETSLISEWKRGMAVESALTQDSGVNTNRELSTAATAVTTNGFRFIDTANPPVFAALATSGTDITNANPAVATLASTGSIQVGDVVRVTDSTGMLQIAGYDFSVTAVSVDTNITLNFDAQNEAAVATAGNVRLIIPNRMFPRRKYIVPVGGLLGISVAAADASQCIVGTSVYHDFSVGERVSFRVPSAFGMNEINKVGGTVISIGNASGAAYSDAVAANYNALRVDVDVSGFTAFSLPTSAVAAAGVSPAELLPAGARPEVGAVPVNVPSTAAFDSRNRFIMRVGTNVITSASAIYDWVAEYSTDHRAE